MKADKKLFSILLLLGLATISQVDFLNHPTHVLAEAITVSFDIVNDDQVIVDQILADPGQIVAPTYVQRPNVRLDGWYIDSDFGTLFDYSDTIVTSMTLFARWDYLIDVDGKAQLTQSIEGTTFKSGDVVLSLDLYGPLLTDIAYRWQIKMTEDGKWRDIPGATAATYNPTMNGQRGYRLVYRTPVYDEGTIVETDRHETASVWLDIYGETPWLAIVVSIVFLLMFSIVYYLSYRWSIWLIVDGEMIAKVRYRALEDISALAVPTKEGHEFDGWYADSECRESYPLKRMPRRTLKLYGRFIKHDR